MIILEPCRDEDSFALDLAGKSKKFELILDHFDGKFLWAVVPINFRTQEVIELLGEKPEEVMEKWRIVVCSTNVFYYRITSIVKSGYKGVGGFDIDQLFLGAIAKYIIGIEPEDKNHNE